MIRIPLSIGSEHGQLHSAVVLPYPHNAIDISWKDWETVVNPQEREKHPETGPVNKEKLMKQHWRYVQLLLSAGVSLQKPQLQDGALCQVFTRDPMFVVGRQAYIGSMRDEYRFGEMAGLQPIRQKLQSDVRHHCAVVLTDHSQTLKGSPRQRRPIVEGGDVMVFDEGNRVLIGTGQTTNIAGYRALAKKLKEKGVMDVVRVPHDALHLDCCYAPQSNGKAIISSQVPAASRDILRRFHSELIPADEDEARKELGLNMFWLNPEQVVSHTRAPKTNAIVGYAGVEVYELEYDQLTSEWGSFHCAVAPLFRGKI